MSDPVVIHPERVSVTKSTQTKATFTFPKRQRFHNPPGSPNSTGNLKDFWNYVVKQAFRPVPKEWPQHHVVPPEIALQQLEAANEHSITWLGHAAFVLQLGGRRIVLDPFLANRASPLSFAGPRRFIPAPLGITDLGQIDTLVISHNHYDHLCWPTLKHMPNHKIVEVIYPTGLAPRHQLLKTRCIRCQDIAMGSVLVRMSPVQSTLRWRFSDGNCVRTDWSQIRPD